MVAPCSEGERLRGALGVIRARSDYSTNITSWHVLSAEPATYGDMPAGLDERLVGLLGEIGIPRLFSHQSEAIAAILAGKAVGIVTPTASGKTLCYDLPVLQALLDDPTARALYLFPTKALAHDQVNTLNMLLGRLGLGEVAATYDGDTPSGQRTRVREEASVVITNPDMLHTGILPAHARWHRFLSSLRYVVVDEMHQYRGVFGSHVANVLRRLQRICAFYGSQPQVILSSATIANPDQLAERLIGRPVTLFQRSGAPRGKRNLVFYNPPLLNRPLGIRRQALYDAHLLACELLLADVQTVVFATSRLAVELLLTSLQEEAESLGIDPAVIRGYRGGYLPKERREIEAGLRDGTVRVVLATNALELGVDISGMTACVMVGYPGTIASTWQQAGRAGRGEEESAAFLVAGDSPLDQYIVSHPRYLLAQSPEHALIDPDNPNILLDHVRCATYELPFTEGERYAGIDVSALLEYLQQAGEVSKGRGRWRWVGLNYPAGQISLRSAEGRQVTIISQDDQGRRETIGLVDTASSLLYLYEGAIYLHEGRQYLVDQLDLAEGCAHVHPVQVDYYTQASTNTQISIDSVLETREHPQYTLSLGEVTLTTCVTGYRRLRLGSHEHLGWGEVSLPEQRILTLACWMCPGEALVERLRQEGWWQGDEITSRGPDWPEMRDRARERDGYRCAWCGAPERPGRQHHVHHLVPFRKAGWKPGENDNYLQANCLENLVTLCPACHHKTEQSVAMHSTLAGLGRVLGNLVPLYCMCDRRDLGVFTDVLSPETRSPTVYIYDAVAGGVGLSEEVLHLYPGLLTGAAELVRDCPCVGGCPSCIGPGAANDAHAKAAVLRLAEALMEG